MTKSKPLGSNAFQAVSDIDDLLDANRRAIVRGLADLFSDNIPGAGASFAIVASNNALASRIATYLLAGKPDVAVNVIAAERLKTGEEAETVAMHLAAGKGVPR